jgi:hypothetical protein
MIFCQKANNTTSVLIFFQENESEIALFFYFTTFCLRSNVILSSTAASLFVPAVFLRL